MDVSESFVVQIGLGVGDSTFLPNNEMLTTVICFPQDSNKDGLRRNAENAFSLDVLTLTEESRCFSQHTRQASLTVEIPRHWIVGTEGSTATDVGRVNVWRETAIVEVDVWRDEQLLDGNVQGQRGKSRDVDNLFAELGRDYGAKDLDEHTHPAAFMYNV